MSVLLATVTSEHRLSFVHIHIQEPIPPSLRGAYQFLGHLEHELARIDVVLSSEHFTRLHPNRGIRMELCLLGGGRAYTFPWGRMGRTSPTRDAAVG